MQKIYTRMMLVFIRPKKAIKVFARFICGSTKKVLYPAIMESI